MNKSAILNLDGKIELKQNKDRHYNIYINEKKIGGTIFDFSEGMMILNWLTTYKLLNKKETKKIKK